MSDAQDESTAVEDLPALFWLLGVDAVPPSLVAAAGLDLAEVRRTPLYELFPLATASWRADGWLVASTVERPARFPAGRARDLLDRIGRHLAADLGARTSAADRDVALAVVRAAVAAGTPAVAASLAAGLWAAEDAPGFTADFAHDLTTAGARAAVAAREPRRLALLLRAASRWFQAHGDLVTAEELAAREWDVWRRAEDVPMAAATLWRRAAMFAARRRGDRELGCYERLESLYQGEGAREQAELVRVWTAMGSALLAYDRAVPAAGYLTRAEKLVRSLPDFPAAQQAAVFEWSGRALWATGAPGPARRRFFDALALLVDLDDRAAERIRGLLANDQDRALPQASPNRFGGPETPP